MFFLKFYIERLKKNIRCLFFSTDISILTKQFAEIFIFILIINRNSIEIFNLYCIAQNNQEETMWEINSNKVPKKINHKENCAGVDAKLANMMRDYLPMNL